MEQEQYYIATEDGQTEGPYLFESLETFYTHGKITKDTLVYIAGGQEWVEFGNVLEQEQKTQACNKDECAPISEGQSEEKTSQEPEPLVITVEDLFRVFGSIALIASIILLVYSIETNHTGIGFIYLLSGVFSCLGCFWCAKVIKLLSNAVDLLSLISKKLYNSTKEE